MFVRGLLGTAAPDPILEHASPSPPQRSFWHRDRVKNVKSMPNRPQRRGGRGALERGVRGACALAHQNRTIAIASDFRVDGAKSPEIPPKDEVLGSEIAARNRRSLATFHRTLKSQCSIAFSCLGNRAISGVRDGHRNRKSQKSLRFRCAKACA